MKAIGVRQFGGPEVLEVVELPEPHPGEGEVRIRVHAATVNPTDALLRAGYLAAALALAGSNDNSNAKLAGQSSHGELVADIGVLISIES